jgi:DNA-binding transcriptional ArsR family regulator
MSSIFPLRENVTLNDEREPRLVDLNEETADEVFTALSSGTTRTIFLELHKAPQTASDLSDVTETSVQNVQYHLEKLLDADLIEVVDTWYSERGSEMKVYAPQDESLVLFAGRDKQGTLRSLLNRVVGVLGVLIPGSALAGYATSRSGDGFGGLFGGGSGGDGGGDNDGGGDANGGDAGNANGEDAEEMSEDAAPEEEADVSTRGGDANGDEADGGGDDGMDAANDGGNGGDGGMENGGDAGDAPHETPEVETGNLSQFDNGTADSIATTDGGQPDGATDGAVDGATDGAVDGVADGALDGAVTAADGAAGVDPALAAAVAFFLGGLFVFVGLTMWYGTPDSWT